MHLVVPTRDRLDLVAGLVRDCGLRRDQVTIINTGPTDVGVQMRFQGVHVIDDHGPINIQRWWNRGIDNAVACGARHVMVINDDIVLTPGVLEGLRRALMINEATLAFPHHTMSGWAWMLDTTDGVRPWEELRWWWGDNDLVEQARRARGVLYCPEIPVQHVHPNGNTVANPALQALAAADAAVFHSRWHGVS